jgi:hypothetical protein
MQKIRQRLIDQTQKGNRRRVVTIETEDGNIDVEMRTPSLATAITFSQFKEGDLLGQYRGMLRAVIACAFDPETGSPIFDPADEDLLVDQPSTGIVFKPLIEVLGELIQEAQETKNSKPTTKS